MKRFVALYLALDASTSTLAKVAAVKRYLADAPARDAAWAVYLLAGGTPRRAVPTAELRALACEAAGLPEWLFEAGYAVTGDLAEAIAYVLPDPVDRLDEPLADWMEQRILPLRAMDAAGRREAVLAAWNGLSADERFMFVKLVGGGFRVGVSKLLVQRALAEWSGADAAGIAQRMMGYTGIDTPPTAERFQALWVDDASGARGGQPYPFFLAHALPDEPATLGERSDWLAEWKYDGIRAQVVKRDGQVWIWSRGEELVTERFPEVELEARAWPDGTVVDGELLAWHHGEPEPAPFALLQKRIGRTKLSKAILTEAPVRLLAYDLLESEGVDRRQEPLHVRRALLERLGIATSPLLPDADWPALAAAREGSRERRVEGLMLKHRESAYGIGRTVGAWWKWKVAPLSVDAVLIYAQAGHGRRANLYTDYSFAVWSRAPRDAAEAEAALDATGGELALVPFAKAYSGLTDEEIKRVDRTVRQTTVEKFGPVRRVRPSLVFELGFEGIQASTRHKSGIAVRFPRMLRIRDDKPLHEADTLDTLRALMGVAADAGE
ncbi:ATP-dependent DNA ligase [Roseateles asaccharophilus]|uniref:DNA ligase (ATP) n=1 Tax=Roseateles asaccharophilus TaxID=582607 RepID=A0ABU2A9E5_9BURK|nr:ATP-dependent DNA ligase [Roseateles asaccharophilus]MDR7333821.1 DNA ligase-1 [Roseateles asaccharophilus]